jgi:hypothetical protein
MSLKQAKKDNKLSPKYYGPYKVLQNIGTMAYKLELPASSRVHSVFHVSCLNKVIGDKILVQTILSELDEEGKIILDPKAITDTRIRQLRNRSILEYLIKWRKLSAEDSTWEDESFESLSTFRIHNRIHLQDKKAFCPEDGSCCGSEMSTSSQKHRHCGSSDML